jgi:hypothetical protein
MSNDITAARLGAAAQTTTTSQPTLSPKGSAFRSCLPPASLRLPVTSCMAELARLLAIARMRSHDHCRRPEEEASFAIEYAGALGEVVVYDALERAGLEPEGYTLLADHAPTGPDFIIGWGFRYDIKTVPAGKFYLSINERQRLNPQHTTDYILPVRLSEGYTYASVYAPIPASKVADWPLRYVHSYYRSIPVSSLQPLAGLEEL